MAASGIGSPRRIWIAVAAKYLLTAMGSSPPSALLMGMRICLNDSPFVLWRQPPQLHHLFEFQGNGFFDPGVTIKPIVFPDSDTKVIGFGEVTELHVMFRIIGH